jgi:hypothetical protein
MNRVEGDEVTEGLHVKNESGLTPRVHGFEAHPQQAGNQPAKLTEMAAAVAKKRPYQLWQSEYVLTMQYRGEQIFFQPLTVSEHPLLMTARAEVARLAGISQRVIVAALIAVDTRKAMVQVAAGHESFEYLALYGSVDEPGRVKFRAVSANTLIQRTRPRIARLVDAASRWVRVRAHGNRARAALLP